MASKTTPPPNRRSRNLPPNLSEKADPSDPSEARTPHRARIRTEAGDRPVLPRTDDVKLPTTAEALASLYRIEARQAFPRSSAWEITELNAERWFCHRFRDLLNNVNRLAGVDITSDEILLLIYDLDHWDDQSYRFLEGIRRPDGSPTLRPEPLHLYLSHGREHWGETAKLIRQLWPEDADALPD